MAIASAICNTFKTEILILVLVQLLYTILLLALVKARRLINQQQQLTLQLLHITLVGSAYSAKGKALTSVTPVLDSSTAVCDFANVSFTSASFTANGCLIFNDTASGDPAVCAIAFGGDKTVSSGTFTIEFPAADASNAIVRIA